MTNKRFKLHLLELDYFEEIAAANPGTYSSAVEGLRKRAMVRIREKVLMTLEQMKSGRKEGGFLGKISLQK